MGITSLDIKNNLSVNHDKIINIQDFNSEKLSVTKNNNNKTHVYYKNFYLNFMAPFYGWGSTASRLEPLRGGSLLFTTKFPEVPGTHFIDLGRMKG